MLPSKPHLLPLPHGQWVSRRCEVRPMGMFLARRLSFDSRDRTWMSEYKYFSDPFCTESVFAVYSSGRYKIGLFFLSFSFFRWERIENKKTNENEKVNDIL